MTSSDRALFTLAWIFAPVITTILIAIFVKLDAILHTLSFLQ